MKKIMMILLKKKKIIKFNKFKIIRMHCKIKLKIIIKMLLSHKIRIINNMSKNKNKNLKIM